MNTKILIQVMLALALATTTLAAAAGGKKELAKAAIGRLLARDAARDAATATEARALANSTRVWRYTTAAQARREVQAGIRPGSHFTPKVTRGRPPRPVTAQRQYGLPQSPEVRMTIQMDKGRTVLRNKALGGQPGRGEVVTMERLPPSAIRGVTRLQK